MREIKFRAWRTNKKFMSPSFTILEWIELGTSCGKLENPDEVLWMQYTGLKDKNGVEIYEGDIFFDGIESCVVEWHRTTASFLANDGDESHGISSFCDYEIIGNIYENPELLK